MVHGSRLALIAFCSAIALTASASDAGAVVRAFFDRYAQGDFSGAVQLWVPGAPADEFSHRNRLRLSRRCMRLASLSIESVDDDRGTVTTVETLALRSTNPDAQEWTETSHSRFELQRVDGEWRIAQWTTRERELVDALEQAKTTAEREAILAAARDLHTNVLVRLMSQRVVELANQQRGDAAGDLSSEAFRIAESLGDVAAMSAAASARSVAVRVNNRFRDFDRSLQLAHEAVALAEVCGDPDVQARALLRLGRAMEAAQGVSGPEFLERAIALAPESEDPAAASIAATTLARYYEQHNQPRAMFRLAGKAYEYAEESGDAAARIGAAMLMAGEYHWIHDLVLAERYHRRVIELATAAGFELAVMSGIQGLNHVQVLREGHAAALHILDEGLSTVRSPLARSALLRSKAESLIAIGRVADAEAAFEESLRLASIDTTDVNGNERFRAALDFARHDFEHALARIDGIHAGSQRADAETLLMKAEIFYCLGRIAEAREILENLISESDISPLSDPEHSLFTVSRARDAARIQLVGILVTQGEYAYALEIAEQMKAGELRDALNGGGIDPDASLSDEERQREQSVEKRIHELNRAWIAERSPERAAALRARLVDARDDLNELRQRAYAADPVIRVQHPSVLSLDDLPPSLDDVTIVSYLDTGADRGGASPFLQAYVLVVEPKRGGHRRVSARILSMSGIELAQRIERFTKAIEQRNLRIPELAEEMYEILLGPIEPQIRTAKSLCIVPDTSLWRVPFHALGRRSQKLLVERVPLFYAPSIAVLAAAESKREERRKHGAPTLLAFANPHSGVKTQSLYRALDRDASIGAIPEAETEAQAIASIYGAKKSRLFVGPDARETVFKTEAPHFDVLHLATHGITYVSAPMFSSLLLAAPARDANEDGVLEAREIATLRLDADLAVLSACETGKGDQYSGGVIGLSWAFFAAGCPTTVVSQWKTQSAATAKLMIEFHRQLSRGASKPVALQRAQLAVRNDPRYRHPFYWAPFVVIGAP